MAKVLFIGSGSGSLAAAAQLAGAGHRVRLLGLLDAYLGSAHADLQCYGSFASLRAQCVGPAAESCAPVVQMLRDGQLLPPLIVRSSWWSRMSRARGGVPEKGVTAPQWCRARYVDSELAISILHDRGGVPLEGLGPSDAISVLAADRVWYSGDAEVWRRQLIMGQGGEIIEDVDVIELEIAGGQAQAVETDVGREWVHSAVFFDCPVHRVVSWLPARLARILAGPAARIPGEHHMQLSVEVERCDLPSRALVGDRAGIWQIRVTRDRETDRTVLTLDIRLAGASDVLAASERIVDEFSRAYNAYFHVVGRPDLRVVESSLIWGNRGPWLEHLNGLRLYHVSQIQQWTRGVGADVRMH